jgi:hypothetical protein
MPKRTGGRETQFLTEDEERRLGESLRKALISDRPNPNRERCLDPKTLRDLAFHRRIGDPEVFERATVHVVECSACVRDALGYAEEYKDLRKKIRAAGVLLVITIVLAVAMSSWTFWILQHKARKVEIAREVPPESTVTAVATGAGKRQDREPEVTQYNPVSIELPPRLRGGVVARPPIVLIRGRLLLEIRLPNGSAAGRYKLRIVNKSGKLEKSIEATSSAENGLTRLKVALDTSDQLAGDYLLSVLEPDLDELSDYPLTVK